jgi:hypothetical protein
MFFELFVQYVFPQTAHFVFRSKSLVTSRFGEQQLEEALVGNTIAFLWHKGAQAEQRALLAPIPHLTGLVTSALPSLNVKTPLGQNSVHRGLPVLAHPSHLSALIVGNQGPSEQAKFRSLVSLVS